MEKETIIRKIETQNTFFRSGNTLDVNKRIEVLKQLRTLIIRYEPELVDSLGKDFHKPEFEVIATETGFVIKELNHTIRKLKSWSRRRGVRTPLIHFLSWSYVMPQPYGQVLILSP